MKSTLPALLTLLLAPGAEAAINLGLLDDFQSGDLAGWTGNANPTVVSPGGPAGTGDPFLQIGGAGTNRFAIFNADSRYSGILGSMVTEIQVDLMRPATDPDALEMRLVLFGPSTNDRWTSANAQAIPNDGLWRRYAFSVLEADLTQVQGSGSYADLAASVNRIMWRHDPAPASATGIFAPGTLGIDNVAAVPEPSTGILCAVAALVLTLRRRRGALDN